MELLSVSVCVSDLHTVCVTAGPDEGKKYVDKTISKHNEIVESIKELCNGLIDLEAKLEVRINRLRCHS